MRKVCIVIDNISNNAGTERAVCNLSNLLAKSGEYKPIIASLYSNNNDLIHYELDSTVEINHMNFKSGGTIFRLLAYIRFLIRFNLRFKSEYDYIVGTTYAINSLFALIHTKAKKVGCAHLNYDSCTTISKKIRRKLYPKLDAVVLLTNADKSHYTDFVDNSKLFVIPNSVSFTSNEVSSLENKRFIALGRLTEQKGFDYLIKAARQLKKALPDWHIDVFGDGPDKEKLLKMCQKYNVNDYVSFNGVTNNVTSELLNSSAYLMTSRFEGLPMVLIEAQICGLPIISFDCPEGPADIIDEGENGFLVKIGDIDSFVECAVRVAKDSELRKKFGINAKKSSNHFNDENVYQKWNSLFLLLERRK